MEIAIIYLETSSAFPTPYSLQILPSLSSFHSFVIQFVWSSNFGTIFTSSCRPRLSLSLDPSVTMVKPVSPPAASWLTATLTKTTSSQ